VGGGRGEGNVWKRQLTAVYRGLDRQFKDRRAGVRFGESPGGGGGGDPPPPVSNQEEDGKSHPPPPFPPPLPFLGPVFGIGFIPINKNTI